MKSFVSIGLILSYFKNYDFFESDAITVSTFPCEAVSYRVEEPL